MTTAQRTKYQYRKTQGGEWVVYGTQFDLQSSMSNRSGRVEVTKKDGTTKEETVTRIGKAFLVDGTAYAYGYLGQTTTKPQGRRQQRGCITDGNCSSFGSGRSCGAFDCDGW